MILNTSQLVQQMFSAGIHHGHKKSELNPKMKKYIYTEKNGLKIINLLQTYKCLKKACSFLFESSKNGKRILFIGTKKYMAKYIKYFANECNSCYINKRWLGGFFTNWKTMRQSILKIQRENISTSKKESIRFERQKKRLIKYLGGVSSMYELPDIVIIVGQQKELNAVKECKKLNIKTLTILDTDCDPDLTDLCIPANDDSLASINFVLNQLSKAIKEGQKQSKAQ